MTRIELPIEGMTCEHCVRTVTGALKKVEGVRSVDVSLADRRAVVESDDGKASRDQLAAAVAAVGYRVPNPQPTPTAPEPGGHEHQPASVQRPDNPSGQSTPDKSGKDVMLDVEGMTCASCVARVESALQ